MRAAFELAGALQPPGQGRRIAVLGDMLELGSDAGAMHASLADDLSANQHRSCLCGGSADESPV